MPSNGVSSVSWHGHVGHIGIDVPRDRYLSHSIGPVCLFGCTPSCGVVLRVSYLVHIVLPPPIHVFFMLHRPRVVERTTLKVRLNTQSSPTHCASWRSWHLFTFMVRIEPLSALCPPRRRLACMSTYDMGDTRHTARILNRVGTHGCLMFPRHPSRRSCLCLWRASCSTHPIDKTPSQIGCSSLLTHTRVM